MRTVRRPMARHTGAERLRKMPSAVSLQKAADDHWYMGVASSNRPGWRSSTIVTIRLVLENGDCLR
jgi:hypothetical protein